MDITITLDDEKAVRVALALEHIFPREAGETDRQIIKRVLKAALKGYVRAGKLEAARLTVIGEPSDVD